MKTKIIKRPTYYDDFKSKGYSRRDFMKFCTLIGAYLGLESAGVAQISEAFLSSPRIPVIWLHLQECTCCSESFIRSSHPMVADILLDKISLDYTETLMAAAGHQAEAAMKKTMVDYDCEYVLCVEGSIPVNDDGVYCCIGGRSAVDILQETADRAKAVICWGSCACNGCVQSAKPNPTGATPVHKLISGVPIIKVPGCPPIGEVMAGVLVHLITFDRIPELDHLGRPKAFYSKRIHDTCYRRPFYDAGLFVESFDDANAQKGYCLYKVGCKGPTTYNACGVMRWNEGVSFPIQSGHGCLGCSEENFWDQGSFYRRVPDFPGFGIEGKADTVGAVVTGAAVAGVVAHGIASTIRRKDETEKLEAEGVVAAEELEEIDDLDET